MLQRNVNYIYYEFPGTIFSNFYRPVDDGKAFDAWEVIRKILTSIRAIAKGVSVKLHLIDITQMLIEISVGLTAPYFHKFWLLIICEENKDELWLKIAKSYTIICNGLTRNAKAALLTSNETALSVSPT